MFFKRREMFFLTVFFTIFLSSLLKVDAAEEIFIDYDDHVSFYDACQNNDVKKMQKIFSQHSPQLQVQLLTKLDSGYLSPLEVAVEREADESVKFLLEKNSDTEIAGRLLSKFLKSKRIHCIESKEKSSRIVKLLLNQGIDPDTINQSLLQAADERWPFIVELLLQYGGNPNIQDGWGFTPFTRAVLRQSYESIRLLIEYGANINTQREGKEPLELLLGRYNFYPNKKINVNNCAQLLLNAGCNPFQKNCYDSNAFDAVLCHQDLKLAKTFLNYAQKMQYDDTKIFIHQLYKLLKTISFEENIDTMTQIYKFMYSIRREEKSIMIEKINAFLLEPEAQKSPSFIKKIYAFINLPSKRKQARIKEIKKQSTKKVIALSKQMLEPSAQIPLPPDSPVASSIDLMPRSFHIISQHGHAYTLF